MKNYKKIEIKINGATLKGKVTRQSYVDFNGNTTFIHTWLIEQMPMLKTASAVRRRIAYMKTIPLDVFFRMVAI